METKHSAFEVQVCSQNITKECFLIGKHSFSFCGGRGAPSDRKDDPQTDKHQKWGLTEREGWLSPALIRTHFHLQLPGGAVHVMAPWHSRLVFTCMSLTDTSGSADGNGCGAYRGSLAEAALSFFSVKPLVFSGRCCTSNTSMQLLH